jgi:uncharacterized membrane protein YagU involved in acid resistance
MPHTRDRTAPARDAGLLGDLIKGAVAGAVAVWVMDRVTWDMYDREPREAYRREKRAQPGGNYAATNLAIHAADLAGVDLPTKRQQYAAGDVVHYGLGIVPGALYGALRRRVPWLGRARGLAYGLLLFVVEDEVANPLLGNTSGPLAYPWQAHWRGLVGHLVLGAVTDTVAGALDELG